MLSSYVFYGWWDWRFLSLIVFSTIIDYTLGQQINNSKRPKFFLILSIVTNLSLLAVFKYFNFFIDTWIDFWNLLGYSMSAGTVSIILPVGISFYTFQTMSYSIDIYKKKFEPTKDFIAFATFVSFFPQLVAGPIERASNLIPQILNKRMWKHSYLKEGLFQITIGFFRKVVIADSIGSYIDVIYNSPDIYDSSTVLIAVILYSFQIYFDFSGYSDIAIGTAKLLGFHFRRNFNLPYFSSSITEFWRRWHISLSSWLRDYLYIPLGGNRKGIVKQYRNLFLTMLLGGLWHGSSWNFVIWGATHGILLAFEKRFNLIPESYKLLRSVLIFSMVTLIWILFRALTFQDTLIIFGKIFSNGYTVRPFIGDIGIFATIIYGLGIGILLDIILFKSTIPLEDFGGRLKNSVFVGVITFLIINIILFYSDAVNFIYFQF
ncbi:MAG: MBOAT family O-acyltransferase [Bacteroidota bacterium]